MENKWKSISWKGKENFYEYFISWKGKSIWIVLDENKMHLKVDSHLLNFFSLLDVEENLQYFLFVETWKIIFVFSLCTLIDNTIQSIFYKTNFFLPVYPQWYFYFNFCVCVHLAVQLGREISAAHAAGLICLFVHY